MKQKSTVLIVDDDPVARSILVALFAREGYELAFATNGSEVLARLPAINPDVILLDVLMPDMDGFELCRRLKTDERWQHIPIILVTALEGEEELKRGFEAGANDFLHKPVNDVELRARVRSMLSIKKQYDELQVALCLREDLARMIVHDMRSPLTAILGFSELLLLKSNTVPDCLEDVEKIHTHAHRLNSYLNDMLLLAKMEENRLILTRSIITLNQLIKQVGKSHETIAQSKRVRLILELPAESREVFLDANLFQRALDNLITNALKFSPAESKVTVQVEYLAECSPSPVPAFHFRLKVLDEGPGIPPEHREGIFDKFEIVAMKQSGIRQVGLGLAFCKMVVMAHGGRISVEANEPTGSVFILEI